MRILAIDASGGRCVAGVVDGCCVLGQCATSGKRGQSSDLPGLVKAALGAAASQLWECGLIVVVVGPGSFTGIRSSMALAHGISASLAIRLVGVTVAEVARASVGGLVDGEVWCATGGGAEQIILDRDGKVGVFRPEALPEPTGPTAVVGNAGAEVASRLAGREHRVAFLGEHAISMLGVARAGEELVASSCVPQDVKPLYIARPAAFPPAGGLRSPPVP